MVWTIIGDRDTQTLLAGKTILNFMHSQAVVGHKNFAIFPCSQALVLALSLVLSLELALTPITSHLVKLSQPIIFNSNKSRLEIKSLQNKSDFFFQIRLKDYFRFES